MGEKGEGGRERGKGESLEEGGRRENKEVRSESIYVLGFRVSPSNDMV